MALGDVYKMTINAQAPGGFFQNTYAFEAKAAPDLTQANFQTLADALKEIWRPNQRSTTSYTNWRATQVRGGTVSYPGGGCERTGGLFWEGTFTGTAQGGLSGDVLPPQCAMVVTLNTGITGRRFRGRVYGFSQVELNQDDGVWIGTHIVAMTTAWNTFMAAFGLTGTNPNFRLGIWSERIATGCVPNPNPPPAHLHVDAGDPTIAFNPVVSFTVRSIVYNQRRRTRGVGR